MARAQGSPPANEILPEADFIHLYQTIGPVALAKRLGIGVRRVYARRQRIEKLRGQSIPVPPEHRRHATDHQRSPVHKGRLHIQVPNGIVLIGSDAHYWPGIVTPAHRAFVRFCKEMNPVAVILNGDVLDGSTISRHPPIGWEDRPRLVDEIEACKDRLGEIEMAAPKAEKIWPLGNHDSRFETRLATVAPEYAKVHGVHLKDSFPFWEPCWSVWINQSVVVKHRFKSGIHAPHNNAMWAGKTMVTGHLHSLKVQPITDYNGTRWGIDCGTLAGGPGGPQFHDYLEDNPASWRSGFVVLTFRDGRLMWPEIVAVVDEDHVEFRGEMIEV